ncbi:MAG: pyruvate oxidase, partial [Chloroflexota bacterium]
HLADTFGQQDVPLDRLYMDVAIYNTRISGPAHVETVANLACRAALSQHGVAHIHFPVDLQTQEVDPARVKRRPSLYTSSTSAQGARLPYEGDMRRAAEILNAGEKIVILAGRGALEASAELELLAEILGAPIIKSLMGKAVVPDSSPYTLGNLGPLGTAPALKAMKECDTLLMVGTSFPYNDYLPEPGQASAIQIDIDPTRISLRYPVDVGLVGDSQRTIKELLPHLVHKQNRSFLETAMSDMQKWWAAIQESGNRMDKPLKPQVVAWGLSKIMADNAIVSCDTGVIAGLWARHVFAKPGQMFAISGNLATMGCGLPYAIAAQVAFPDRPCIAFVGEGGFSMLMSEFITCVNYRLPVKVVLVRDNDFWQSLGGHLREPGNTEVAVESHPIDHAAFARACGASGFVIDTPEDCELILAQALNTPGPVIIETRVDTRETSMDSSIGMEAARGTDGSESG